MRGLDVARRQKEQQRSPREERLHRPCGSFLFGLLLLVLLLPLLLHLRVVREPASFFLSKRNLLSRRLVHNSPAACTGTTGSRETECQEREARNARYRDGDRQAA